MGDSNVGKTVFFGSYFHQVTDLSKGKYPLAIKSQSSDDKITEIITQLFDKKQPVVRTDVRVDFSFSVDSLGIDIELTYGFAWQTLSSEKIYVRADEGKAYWVWGEETGSVELW